MAKCDLCDATGYVGRLEREGDRLARRKLTYSRYTNEVTANITLCSECWANVAAAYMTRQQRTDLITSINRLRLFPLDG